MRSPIFRALCAASFPFFASAASAGDFFVKPSLKQTAGSGGYEATSASVDFGSSFHLKPGFDAYHSNSSSGTVKTYSLRASYDTDGQYGYSVNGGWSPLNDGYKNHFIGGELTRDIDFDDEDSTEEARGFISNLNLSAGLTHTTHTDSFQLQTVKGRRVVLLRPAALDIDETDLTGSAAVTARDTVFELDVLKAVYNKDLAALSARGAQATQLAGLVSTIQGFPNANASFRVQFDQVPVVSPYVSYTYTSYAIAVPISQAYSLGAVGSAAGLRLDAAYQRFSQKTGADINYYSLRASYRF
ncbi:MAG: hypothetical protein ACHQ51_02445 [Elusimicrobiota bacterium]